MIKVCFVRGKFLNNFEGQNYLFNPKYIQFTAVSSLFSLHRSFPFPVKKFISLVDFPFLGRGIKYLSNRLLGDSQILFGLEELADEFDIFHTADPHYYYSYQLARLRQKNLIKKLIMTSWETISFNNESVKRKKQIKYFSLGQVDYFICYTRKAKDALVREGVDGKKISVIKLGVNLERFKPKIHKITRSLRFVKNRWITILFVGRLTEEKGILDLYKAYKNVKFQMSNVKSSNQKLILRIIGDGGMKKELTYLIKRDRLENFVNIEKKIYEEMPNVYQEADIFVLPSKRSKTWEEQYGMALVEAMASGLPIVAYNTGAISEILGNVGILINQGEMNELVISIKHLIENNKYRMELGKMGRERAEKEFDSRKTAKNIESIYKQIAGPTRKPT